MVLATGCITLALAQAPVTPTNPSQTILNFEVATIKPNTSADNGSSVGYGRSDLFTASNNTVKRLLQGFPTGWVEQRQTLGFPARA